MPIEIRELLIRALVGGKTDEKKEPEKKKETRAVVNNIDTLSAIKDTINRQKER